MRISVYLVLGFVAAQLVTGIEDVNCHCLNERDCPTACNSSCVEDWYGPYCRAINIAKGRNSTFSSVSVEHLNGTAEMVTDGDTSDGDCASIQGRNPEWEIQFHENMTITSMRVFWSEADAPPNVVVLVGDIACYSQQNSTPPPRDFSFSCFSPVRADSVKILLQSSSDVLSLTLCEVEIHECSDGFYGKDCADSCNCVRNRNCDKVTGACFKRALEETEPPSAPPSSSTDATRKQTSTTAPETSTTSLHTTDTTKPTVTVSSTVTTTGVTKTEDPDRTIIIAAVVVGLLALLILIIIIVVIWRKKRRHNKTPLDNQNNASDSNNTYSNLGFTPDGKSRIPKGHERQEHAVPVRTAVLTSNSEAGYAFINPLSVSDHRAQELVNRPAPARVQSSTDLDEPHEDPEGEELPSDVSDPYYSQVHKAIPVGRLAEYVKERLDGEDFNREYTFLPFGLKANHETGLSRDNNLKNRYRKMYSYDHSRVVLERGENDECGTDYINASHIQGYKAQWKFIATQGPMLETIADFWLMVWQQNTREIIMLTNIIENFMKKCEKYWPDEGESSNYGFFTVCLKSTQEYADYTVRVLSLHHQGEDQPREVTLCHFTAWPDHGVPSTVSLVRFWKRLQKQLTLPGSERGPVVVHCSAGVGRTGTFIGLDSLVEQADSEGKVNIFTTVLGMRDDRVNMVQTKEQYYFLHTALLEALHCKDTMTRADDISEKLISCNTMIEKEYEQMRVMTSLRIGENRKETLDRKGAITEMELISLPSHFNTRGFLHVTGWEGKSVERLWKLICEQNAVTIVTLDQETPSVIPATERTLTRYGGFELIFTSREDLSEGITERWLSLSVNTGKPQTPVTDSGMKNVVLYSLPSTSEEIHFNRNRLLSLIDLIIGRQLSCGHHPVILLDRDKKTKCALFTAATNVITCLRFDQEVDIYLTVREIQCHKGQPVTCLDDYRFLYQLASDYVHSSETYETSL